MYRIVNRPLNNIGDLSHLPGDDDLLRLPIEIYKRLFINDEQPIVISMG